MKKKFSLVVLSILSVLILGVTLPSKTQAAEFSFKDQYSLETGKSVNDNLYLFGDDAVINGTVYGDLISFGRDFKLNGYVTGNVYTFGENVVLTELAQIDGNLNVFALKTQLGGRISRNTTIFTSTVNHTGTVGEDLTIFAGDSILSGDIGDDLRVFSSTSSMTGDIDGDAIVLAQKYNIKEEKVGGKVYDQKAINLIAKSQGVDLEKNNDKEWIPREVTFGIKLNNVLIGFTSMLIAGAFLIFMSPVKTGLVVKKISASTEELLKSFGIGLAVLFLAWIPILFLLVSVVGIPLAGILFGFLLFIMIFGSVWVEIVIGREILGLFKVKEYRPFKSFLIGRTVSTIAKLIPVIGGLYTFVVTSVALGAFVRMKKDFFDKQSSAVTKKTKETKKK